MERNRQVELRSARRTWTKLLLVWLCLLLFCGGLIILTRISEPCCSLNGDMTTVKPLSGIVVKTEILKRVISQDGNQFSANHDQSDYFRDNLESDHWNCEAEDTCSALRTSQIRCGFDGCSTNQNKSFEKTSLDYYILTKCNIGLSTIQRIYILSRVATVENVTSHESAVARREETNHKTTTNYG